MTGITRVSKESIFSDLNNLEVVTTTSSKYADCFGLTEQEVFAAMDKQGMQGVWLSGYWKGKSFETELDERIVFDQLDGSINAVWSLLLATGYLKALE